MISNSITKVQWGRNGMNDKDQYHRDQYLRLVRSMYTVANFAYGREHLTQEKYNVLVNALWARINRSEKSRKSLTAETDPVIIVS